MSRHVTSTVIDEGKWKANPRGQEGTHALPLEGTPEGHAGRREGRGGKEGRRRTLSVSAMSLRSAAASASGLSAYPSTAATTHTEESGEFSSWQGSLKVSSDWAIRPPDDELRRTSRIELQRERQRRALRALGRCAFSTHRSRPNETRARRMR